MSQHHYACTWQGRPISIMMGWDRPLQGFFMVIEFDDAGGQDEENEEAWLLYSNLNDPVLAPTSGMASSCEYFQEKLSALGVRVPAQMIEAVDQDGKTNAGNREAWYDRGGRVVATAHYEESRP